MIVDNLVFLIFKLFGLLFLKSKSPRGDRAQNVERAAPHHYGRSVGAAARRRVLANIQNIFQKKLPEKWVAILTGTRRLAAAPTLKTCGTKPLTPFIQLGCHNHVHQPSNPTLHHEIATTYCDVQC